MVKYQKPCSYFRLQSGIVSIHDVHANKNNWEETQTIHVIAKTTKKNLVACRIF